MKVNDERFSILCISETFDYFSYLSAISFWTPLHIVKCFYSSIRASMVSQGVQIMKSSFYFLQSEADRLRMISNREARAAKRAAAAEKRRQEVERKRKEREEELKKQKEEQERQEKLKAELEEQRRLKEEERRWAYLTLCMLGKNFSRQHFEIFFLFFSRK